MSAITQLKKFKYISKGTWRVANAKDWENSFRSGNCTIKSDENVVEECPNVKWHASITRSNDNITFAVNVTHLRLDSQKKSAFEYKLVVLVCRGSNRNYWIFWDTQKEKLKEANVFTKELGNLSTFNKCLNGDDFEVRISLELFVSTAVTKQEPPLSESIHREQQHVLDSLKDLLTSGNYSDFTVRLGEKQYRLHKSILSARSLFFADYFLMNPDAKNFAVTSEDVKEDIFDALMKFVYTGEYENTESVADLLRIFALADEFKVKDLKEISEFKLETLVTPQNAINMLHHAFKFHSEHGLKRRVFDSVQVELGITFPSKLYDRSLEEIQEFIEEEMRMIELDLQEMSLNKE